MPPAGHAHKVRSNRQAVIILQSDHGFGDLAKQAANRAACFSNLTAFYFPDEDYSTLPDQFSNVNTFPLLLNKYFGTQIPMQQDSSFFLGF